MWSALPQLPSVAPPNSGGDSWNLSRRRNYVRHGQIRPQPGGLGQISYPNQDIGGPQLPWRPTPPADAAMLTEDAEMMRAVYENHANRFFEDLRSDMLKQAGTIMGQTQLAKKPGPAESKDVDVSSLQEQLNALQRQVDALERAPAKGIDHSAVQVLCTEVVNRVLAERGPLLSEKHLRHLEGKVTKLEQSLQTSVSYELQELRTTSAHLVKRVNRVASASGQLEERLATFEKERERVGTARAEDWMSTARRQLEDFGSSLKSARSKAADPAAQELLKSMERARAALESGPRESSQQASSGMGLVMWGKGDVMQMHACLQEEDVVSMKPMALPTEDGETLPILFEESASPRSDKSQKSHVAESLGSQSGLDHMDDLKARACGALEMMFLDEEDDMSREPRSAPQDLVDIEEQKVKARAALELLFAGEDTEDEDDSEDNVKARAREAVELALLGELLGDDGVDEPEDAEEEEVLKLRAQEALEAALLGL